LIYFLLLLIYKKRTCYPCAQHRFFPKAEIETFPRSFLYDSKKHFFISGSLDFFAEK